jgi:hypothetical protein
MANIHEMQKTDTPMTGAQSHDKPQTLGTQVQNVGTQVKETCAGDGNLCQGDCAGHGDSG